MKSELKIAKENYFIQKHSIDVDREMAERFFEERKCRTMLFVFFFCCVCEIIKLL
jgi:hypothetical protein